MAGLLDSSLTLYDYKLDLIPYDTDLLSMEAFPLSPRLTHPNPHSHPAHQPSPSRPLQLDYSFRDCYVNGDHTTLYFIARSIMKLQSLYGLIPSIKAERTPTPEADAR